MEKTTSSIKEAVWSLVYSWEIGPFLEKIAIVILVELHKQHLCIWNSKRTTFLWNESLGAVYNQVCSQFSKQIYKYAQVLI